MRNRFLLGAGVALAVALSSADAGAQFFAMPSGPGAWYLGGEGGWTMLENGTGSTLGSGLTHRYNDGFNVGARLGYEWGPLRIEEEFNFRQNGIRNVSGFGATVGTTGNRNTYAFMTNLIYDFTFGWPFSPHIGGGIGAVQLHDSWGIPGFGTIASSSDWVLGYQGIAGIRYNINPALAFDLDYRYLGTTDPSFGSNFAGVRYTSSYSSHSVLASLSVRFGAPPPPPVVAPPAPMAPPPIARKVFLVFFDWDKDTITPEGMQIIQQAAGAFRAGGPVTIQVTGYADRSGSPGYNQRLSERRANNVANAMTRMGVPRQQMAVSGRGENDNRVPTADGVREPQNRRVEIVF
jgi:outer membrane protein OmpA-like peptidoglycan-associated protein/opacity protein-like surface antigen